MPENSIAQHPQRWKIARRMPIEAHQALDAFDPIFAQILFNRGYTSNEIAMRYVQALPLAEGAAAYMLGIDEAVTRIRWAIQHNQPIAVYGDYDVDGVTATTLLTQALAEHGADVRAYIPNRFDEGYGLNNEALDSLKEAGVQLVITVDCGIRSLDEASHARRIGLDLIISDHHQPKSELPQAIAVINPKQPGDDYPEKDLAGVGLAYKLASALFDDDPGIESYLDLVALGTVADLAPLSGENRALVRRGLEYLRFPQRQGILSLMGVAGIAPGVINAGHIGFALGPRLNAAGRLDSALQALELLSTRDLQQAGALAQYLDNQNRERQQITRLIQEQAELLAFGEDPETQLLFAAHPDFNPGVVGLAASRLSERYYRPAIVAHQGQDFTRASCRSIPEFHITAALDECADLLERHGGHAAAAGFTVKTAYLSELVMRLKEIAYNQLADLDLRRTLAADIDLPLSELKPDLLKSLRMLEPTGQGNPQAVFVSRQLKPLRARAIGRDETHLKLDLSDGRITYAAIGFNLAGWLEKMPPRVDAMYIFELNEYNGRQYLQLNLLDLKPSGAPDD